MSINYLLNVVVSEKEQAVNLTFFNSSDNKWIELLDSDYRPYFFISHPITKEDVTVIQELGVRTRVEDKTDLFTGQNVKLTRIALEDFSDHLQISRKFSKSWQTKCLQFRVIFTTKA